MKSIGCWSLVLVFWPCVVWAEDVTFRTVPLTGDVYVQERGAAGPRELTDVYGLLVRSEADAAIKATVAVEYPNPGATVVGLEGLIPHPGQGASAAYRFSSNGFFSGPLGLPDVRVPWVRYQEGKIVGGALPAITVSGSGVTQDFAFTDLCSLTVEFEGQTDGEEITNVWALARTGALDDPTDPDAAFAFAEFYSKTTTGNPKDLTEFLSVKNGARESAVVEMLVRPGLVYEVLGFVIFDGFGDQLVPSQVSMSVTVDAANCSNASVKLPVRKGSGGPTLSGSLWMQGDPSEPDAPTVSDYAFMARDERLVVRDVQVDAWSVALDDSLIPVGDASVAYSVPVSDGRLDEIQTYVRFGIPFSDAGFGYGADLTMKGTQGFWSPHRPAGPQGVFPDGSVRVGAGEHQTADFKGAMALMRGRVETRGCVDLKDLNMKHSRVELSGADASLGTYTDGDGHERPILGANAGALAYAQLVQGTGEYTVVGVPGDWDELRLNLRFAQWDLDGVPGTEASAMSDFHFGDSFRETLTAGYANRLERNFLVEYGRVNVRMTVPNDDGTLRPFSSAGVAGTGIPFRYPSDASLGGTVDVAATRNWTPATEQVVSVAAPPGKADLVPTVLIPRASGDRNAVSFGKMRDVPFRAPRADGTCAATCAVQELQEDGTRAWAYYDDDELAPLVTWDAVGEPAPVPKGRIVCGDSVVLTGTVSDESPVSVTANGRTGTVAGDGRYSVEVPLPDRLNTITVRYEDRCGGETTLTDRIYKNCGPVIDVPPTQTIRVGDALEFLVDGWDPENDPIVFTGFRVEDNASETPLTLEFDPATRRVFIPATDLPTPRTFLLRFTVQEMPDLFGTGPTPGLTDTDDVLVIVREPNRPPVIAVPGATTVEEGEDLTFTVTATDPDGDTLTFSTSGPGTIDPQTGVYTLPAGTPPGTYDVTFTVTDGEATDTKTVVITVTEKPQAPAPNRPPVFDPVDDIETDGPGGFTVVVTDPDGDTLTCKADKLPPGATFDPVSMTVSWEDIRPSGRYTAEITCSDGNLSSTLVVNIRARVFDRVGGGLAGCSSASGAGVLGLVALLGLLRRRRAV